MGSTSVLASGRLCRGNFFLATTKLSSLFWSSSLSEECPEVSDRTSSYSALRCRFTGGADPPNPPHYDSEKCPILA